MASRTITIKKLLIFNSILVIPVFVCQKTDFSQIYIKRIKQIIMNKVQAATHDNAQYKIISTNSTNYSGELDQMQTNKEILEIMDLIQKKQKNTEQEEEEGNTKQQNKKDDKKNKEKEKNEDEDDDEEDDSDEESDGEDSDDDDDKNGGILIPIIEWVKGIIPRVVPTPQS